MIEKRRVLEEVARRSGGVFRAKDAAEGGVHWRDLYALRDEGFVVELSRGVFRLADAEMSPYLDLIAVSRRSPRGVICLNSALSFWDLTDEIPAEVHLAVPRGSRPPSIDYPPTRVHVFAADTFDLGRERVRLESGDAVRMRGRVGADVAYEALRRYLRRPGSSSGELLRLARRLRARGPVADALEVLTG